MAELPRGNGEPGTWRPLTLDIRRRTAVLFCPDCGRRGTLEDHVIEDDGRVSPSVVCPNDCGFHDFVTLAGWEG